MTPRRRRRWSAERPARPVEAARAPGAWWALTRALVGFEAGEAEAATATATETDPAVRALAARGALGLRPVAPPAGWTRDVFLNHALRDAPVDRYALPRHRWWPSACWRATCLSHPSFPPATSASSRTRFACWRREARRDSVPRGRVPSAREGTRSRGSARDSRRANATFEFSNRIDEKTNRKAPEWTAAGRASKRSAGIGRGGAFARWTRFRGKKVLGKSFYDASVRAPPGDDAYHRSRLANHRSVLAGGSRRAGSDDGSDHRPAADADDDARSLSSLGEEASSVRDDDGDTRAEIRRPREIRLPLRCSQVFPGCPRRSRGAPAWTRSARGGGTRLWSDERRSDESARPSARAEERRFGAEKKRGAETVAEETPRWTKSGARILTASERALASRGGSELDLRCKACFYAKVSRKRCGSAKAFFAFVFSLTRV